MSKVSKKCYLVIKCPRCGAETLIEFWKPFDRSEWYIRSQWVKKDVVWIDQPKERKKKKKMREGLWKGNTLRKSK